MYNRDAKIFLMVVGLYFVTKDVGALVLYSKRQSDKKFDSGLLSSEKRGKD